MVTALLVSWRREREAIHLREGHTPLEETCSLRDEQVDGETKLFLGLLFFF